MTDRSDKALENLLLDVVRSLVDKPQAIRLETIHDDGSVTFRIHVEEREVGKVIGTGGRMARALRLILNANAARLKREFHLDIVKANGGANDPPSTPRSA